MGATAEGSSVLWNVWADNAARDPDREAIVHWVAGESPRRWSWRELIEAASGRAEDLRGLGIRPGQVCAIIVRHHPDFYPLYMGVSACGALPAVLAYPNPRLHPDKFRHGLEGMASRSGLDWVLTEGDLLPIVRPLLERPGSTIRGIVTPLDRPRPTPPSSPFVHPEADPEGPCLLQHSSGTTGLQKAVVLSHRAILGQVRSYARAIRLRPDDKVVSWLPLYHDMGLIAAFYLPLITGIPLVQLDPFEWIKAPLLLLEALSVEGGTISWLPNFAYNLLADRVHEEDLDGIRLDRVRLLVNCSEPIRWESHERFGRRFRPHGLDPAVLSACYAMAETTFAATQTEPGSPARVVVADRGALSRGVVAPPETGTDGRACVSSGMPIDGCEMALIDEAGQVLADDRVGEIVVRAGFLFDGYRNQPAMTAEVLRDGWYRSGDYGFRRDGEYYVIGRKKDLIIVAGKNIYPEDVEDAIGDVEGILPGRVVAFAVEDEDAGTESVAVVAETAVEGDDALRALRMEVIKAAMAIDVTIARLDLVPPRWLIKSSSGKPSRPENKKRVLALAGANAGGQR